MGMKKRDFGTFAEEIAQTMGEASVKKTKTAEPTKKGLSIGDKPKVNEYAEVKKMPGDKAKSKAPIAAARSPTKATNIVSEKSKITEAENVTAGDPGSERRRKRRDDPSVENDFEEGNPQEDAEMSAAAKKAEKRIATEVDPSEFEVFISEEDEGEGGNADAAPKKKYRKVRVMNPHAIEWRYAGHQPLTSDSASCADLVWRTRSKPMEKPEWTELILAPDFERYAVNQIRALNESVYFLGEYNRLLKKARKNEEDLAEELASAVELGKQLSEENQSLREKSGMPLNEEGDAALAAEVARLSAGESQLKAERHKLLSKAKKSDELQAKYAELVVKLAEEEKAKAAEEELQAENRELKEKLAGAEKGRAVVEAAKKKTEADLTETAQKVTTLTSSLHSEKKAVSSYAALAEKAKKFVAQRHVRRLSPIKRR